MTQVEVKTEALNKTPSKKNYIREIPTIYEKQFYPDVSENTEYSKPLDLMAKSCIVALTGPRGGIKSGSLAYIVIWAMAKGHPVYTNLPTKCWIERVSGKRELFESQPLVIEDLIMAPAKLEGALVGWDEYQQWDRSGGHMSTQHQLLISEWEQIRHQEITFVYVSKRINLIPGDIAWETDIEINCRDVSNGPDEVEGTRCAWEIKDLSGLWTGRMFDPKHPVIYRAGFYHRAIMGSYDTKQRFDPLEARRGFQVDLQKKIISDKEMGSDFISEEEYQQIKSQAMILLAENTMRRAEFFTYFNIDNSKVKSFIQARLMRDIGLRELYRGGSTWVRLEDKVGRFVPA